MYSFFVLCPIIIFRIDKNILRQLVYNVKKYWHGIWSVFCYIYLLKLFKNNHYETNLESIVSRYCSINRH